MLDGWAVAWGCKGHAGRVCSVGDRVWGVAIRVLSVNGIARPDVHKMSGYSCTRVQNSGVLSSYGMFLGAMGMPKPTIVDR